MKNYDKFLPIGTVVSTKKGKEKLMIIGFLTSDGENQSRIYDYSACVFPLGVYTNEATLVFDHSDIKEIYYIGYNDKKSKELSDNLLLFEKKYVDENRKLKMSIMDIMSDASKK